MTRTNDLTASRPLPPILAALLACTCAGLLVLALAHRPLSTVDLGYHLAYGQSFWRTGHVVSDASFVLPRPMAADAKPGDLGPGCYYDAQGNYRFPNANWLTQVIMAGVYNLGGWSVLSELPVLLLAIILAAQAGVLRRNGASLAWTGPVWLLTGIAAYERFDLRPELLGYLCAIVQLWLLSGRISWLRVAAVLAVQLLAVNVHSYWLLGAAAIFAFAGDAAARAGWNRWIVRGRPLSAQARSQLIRLLVLAVLTLPSPLANPSGWRNAALPVQTVIFLNQNHISGATPDEVTARWQVDTLHPWAVIAEFYTPFIPKLMHARVTEAYITLLALAVPAGLVLLWRRQWALAAILAMYLVISLSMRRNIAPAAMMIAPLIAVAAHLAIQWWRQRGAEPGRPKGKQAGAGEAPASPLPPWARWASTALLAGVAGLSAWWLVGVVTNQFYIGERRESRFGSGLSRLMLPLGPCQWLDEHLDRPQPIYTDYNSSSSIAWFSAKTAGVPTLTNTWAYPPGRMRLVVSDLYNQAKFSPIARSWGMDFAVIQVWPGSTAAMLARELAGSREWAMVYAETWYVVFARRTPANEALIAASAITPETFSVESFIADCRRADAVPAFALQTGASMLQSLDWFEQAEPVWRACLADRSDFHEAWLNLGVCLAEKGRRELLAADQFRNQGKPNDEQRCLQQALGHYKESRHCFQQTITLKGDYGPVRANLDQVREVIKQLE